MSVTKIHHHKICVTDMERSLRFYRDLLGFELIYDAEHSGPDYDQIMDLSDCRLRVAMLRDRRQQSMLGLLEFHHPPMQPHQGNVYVQGFCTLALEVDDIEADLKRLIDAGVRALSPLVDLVRGGKRVARAVYVFDPDGLRIELYQPEVAIENAR